MVAEVLHTAYAEGRITLAEHEERTDAVLQARTFDDLTTLTDDLVPVQPLPLHRPEQPSSGSSARAPSPNRTGCPP